MQLTLVSKETEEGFNKLGFHMSTGYGMTQEIARKWIREEYGLDVRAALDIDGWFWSIDDIDDPILCSITQGDGEDELAYKTYEMALEKGLIKFCELFLSFPDFSKN